VHGGRIGYDYLHVAVDDHSRVAYIEALPDERDLTCAGFLHRDQPELNTRDSKCSLRCGDVGVSFAWRGLVELCYVVSSKGLRQVWHAPVQITRSAWSSRRTELPPEPRTPQVWGQ